MFLQGLISTTIAATLMLQLAVQFIFTTNFKAVGWYFLLVSVSACCYLITPYFHFSGLALSIYYLDTLTPWAMWAFSFIYCRDKTRLHFSHFLALAIYSILFHLGYIFRYDAITTKSIFLLADLFHISMLALSVYELVRHYNSDLVENRRLVRRALLSVILLLLLVAISINYLLPMHTVDNLGFFLFRVTMIVMLLSVLLAQYLINIRRNKKGDCDAKPNELDELNKRLAIAFDEHKIHTDSNITLASVAQQVEQPEYKVRKCIIQSMNFRNFNDLVNDYRVNDVAEKLADPTFAKTPILTLALEVGFNSISPFNRVFKEKFNMTPSLYRKNSLNRKDSLTRKESL